MYVNHIVERGSACVLVQNVDKEYLVQSVIARIVGI
jgi:hypothetical protein